MDSKLRAIVSKSAGTYFIVTDNSDVETIESDAKLRLFFINSEKGPVNMLVKFAQGTSTSFTNMFGKSNRLKEKRGNFSISTCLDAITQGPIAVVNLRVFDDTLDLAGILGLNPNVNIISQATTAYRNLFNTNNFWSAKPANIAPILTNDSLLTFGNVGNTDLSIIVKLADETDVQNLTSDYDKTLTASSLEIDEYPALKADMLLKDTFVSVYVFNNTFGQANVSTNKNYGQYFGSDGSVDIANLETLSGVSEAGFVKKFTGSMIPNLVSENSDNISIDDVINNYYTSIGLICDINVDLLEEDNQYLIDPFCIKFYSGLVKVVDSSPYMLSHVMPSALTSSNVIYPPVVAADLNAPANTNRVVYPTEKISAQEFAGIFSQGIKIGDYVVGADEDLVQVTSIEAIATIPAVVGTNVQYDKVKYVCDGNVKFTGTTTFTITKVNKITDKTVKPFDIAAYKPRTAQFTDGTAQKQSDILDIMNDNGIVRGIIGTSGIRYLVDCFKSFVEPNYKNQFGTLANTLDGANRFVRTINNEPFIEDLEKSTNPLFKDMPNGNFDWSYLTTGGNTQYSSKLLTKPTTGATFMFFFGPGNIVNHIPKPMAGLVSNLFYAKTADYDVVANETGYIDATELESGNPNDSDRAYCEAFKYNPIIKLSSNYSVFGNNTAQKKITSLSQIHNSELLAYIKQQLFNLSKSEAFKKGTDDDYQRTQTECQSFMNNLALAGAIDADPTVQCDLTNNTQEIRNQRIKLVNIEFTPTNALEKIVFDLVIN